MKTKRYIVLAIYGDQVGHIFKSERKAREFRWQTAKKEHRRALKRVRNQMCVRDFANEYTIWNGVVAQ